MTAWNLSSLWLHVFFDSICSVSRLLWQPALCFVITCSVSSLFCDSLQSVLWSHCSLFCENLQSALPIPWIPIACFDITCSPSCLFYHYLQSIQTVLTLPAVWDHLLSVQWLPAVCYVITCSLSSLFWHYMQSVQSDITCCLSSLFCELHAVCFVINLQSV